MVRKVRARTRPTRACAFLLAAAALACGAANGTDAPAGSSTAQIRIVNYAFTPQRIAVAPGTAVLILNLDPFQHTVTSEAVAGSHVPGAVNGVSFDTPPFTGGTTVTVPAAAPPGTVIPYYCRLHGAASAGDGAIEVVAP